MTAVSFVRDLAAFSVQIAIVVVVVAGLLRLVRMPARVRYICLRLTLLACLVVPWTLRSVVVVTEAPAGTTARRVSDSPASAASSGVEHDAMTQPATRHTGPTGTRPGLPWTTIGVVALLVGVTARVIWLAIGFFRLQQLTRRAVPIESGEYATVQEQLGTAAIISEVDRLAQPVTFGFRRPVVLLPGSLADASAPVRRAVVTHELFHVRRGDWLSLLGEEAIRTMLWFHPAIHWLTSSIQLAREEMVDELTVRATGDRRAYMQALLAFADTDGLRTAPAFAHRRQLFHRIVSVSKEKVMSAPRIVISASTLAIGVFATIWYASSAFPIVMASRIEPPAVGVPPIDDGWLIAEPQFVTVAAAGQRGAAPDDREEVNEVTPENPIPRRTRGASPVRPTQFAGIQDGVVVETLVRISRDGVVTNVFDRGCSVSQGPTDEATCRSFFDASASAIRQWRYDRPVRGPLQFSVVVTFGLGREGAVVQAPSPWANPLRETQNGVRLLAAETEAYRQRERDLQTAQDSLRNLTERFRELERAYRLTLEKGQSPANPDLMRLQERLALLTDQMSQEERALRRATTLSEAAARLEQTQELLGRARAAQEAAREAESERAAYDARVRALAERGLIAPSHAQGLLSQPTNERPLVSPSGRTPVRVGATQGIKAPTVTKSVKAEHPVVAMQARVQGTVIVEALVDEQGRVADARVVKSIPLLDRAALDAAKQWEFTPTVINGEPVPVLVTLEMNFALK